MHAKEGDATYHAHCTLDCRRNVRNLVDDLHVTRKQALSSKRESRGRDPETRCRLPKKMTTRIMRK
jgi:hypothetical protein